MKITSQPNFKNCHATINLKFLLHNLNLIKQKSPSTKVTAMVKANAYGHGLIEISRFLEKHHVKHFGVATVEEAVELRKANIKSEIWLMGGAGFLSSLPEIIEENIVPLISSFEELKSFIDFLKTKRSTKISSFHLDLDTGMTRAGIQIEDNSQTVLEPFVSLIKKNKGLINLAGIATHFANAENLDCQFTQMQIKRFIAAVKYLESEGFSETAIHFAKSAAIFTDISDGGKLFKNELRNYPLFIRPGLSLYGISPLDSSNKNLDLKPILTWKTTITLRKSIKKGTLVGYNNTWKAQRDTELAVLRVGYGDGYNRQLSNQGHVLIQGQKAPIIGRVSMDLVTIDVTDIVKQHGLKACQIGNLATLIGQEDQNKISAQDLSKLCHTIPYEILTNISNRVARDYVF